MATNKVPSLCKQPDCMKLMFCYGEEFITDLIISTDLGYVGIFFEKKKIASAVLNNCTDTRTPSTYTVSALHYSHCVPIYSTECKYQ